MDYSPIINEVAKLWWVISGLLVIGIFKTPWFKGLLGESLVRLAARLRLPAKVYFPIHNVTLPTPDGTTQIDHVFVSRFGVFVVETKNMKGWIVGVENQPRWTQKLHKRSFSFQNPLRQNYKHVKALQAMLDVPAETIRSVIVFTGESRFKSSMPANVTKGGGYITYIKSFTEPVLSEMQVQEVIAKIGATRLAPTRETHRRHVEQLRMRSDPSVERECPKCGNSMVLRTAKRGSQAGSQFWGCSSYPQCKTMQKIGQNAKGE